jgi:hypothetical protein
MTPAGRQCREIVPKQNFAAEEIFTATLDPATQKASYNGERTAFALIWRKVDPAMRPVV